MGGPQGGGRPWGGPQAGGSPRNQAQGGGQGGAHHNEPSWGFPAVRRFVNQLDLAPDQRARIGPIFRRTNEERARLHRETQMETALKIERMLDDVEGVLTSDQRLRFEDNLQDRRKLLRSLIDGHHPGARGPGAGPVQPVPAPATAVPPAPSAPAAAPAQPAAAAGTPAAPAP